MAVRTWLGGGNNNASNRRDWSPIGLPQSGDTLSITDLASPIMNVRGNDLAGDLLSITRANATVNLRGAAASVSYITYSNATFNLSHNSTLSIQHVVQAHMHVNVSGSDNLGFDLAAGAQGTVDLAQNATWHGTFTMGSFNIPVLKVNGAAHSVFDNNGTSVVGALGQATINSDVGGSGSFDVHSKLEFGGSVGSSQSVVISSTHDYDQGIVKIDHPSKFLGSVTMSFIPPTSQFSNQTAPEVDLMGLVNADSYLYRKGVLTIFSGLTPIENLRLSDNTTNGFAVQQTAGGVHVLAITDPTHPPTGLPVHNLTV